MKKSTFNKRFFESTRGRIVMLLRGTDRTVDELARELTLTDNAVRAQLLTLERDGLIAQSGTIKGFRKPHFAYGLTAEAEHLFPKPYDALFNQLLESLKGRLPAAALENVLAEVGQRIGEVSTAGNSTEMDLDARLAAAVKCLEDLGGTAEIVNDETGTVIRSNGCPLSAAVVDHPEVCKLTEALIAEIVDRPVKEYCNREKMPRCRFEIDADRRTI